MSRFDQSNISAPHTVREIEMASERATRVAESRRECACLDFTSACSQDGAAALSEAKISMHRHRSFPDAADGRPMPPMGDELMIAGLNDEDARFVAIQLAQNGLALVRMAAE